jgi:hypothetical protein
MQIEILDAVDRVIFAPTVSRAIGAACKQAMQNRQEHRAFERKAVFAGAGEVFDHGAAAGLFPQALEHQSRPDAARRIRRQRSLGVSVDHNGLGGEAGARPQQPLQLTAVAQILEAPQRGDHLLTHLRAVATTFDDLKIGATARGLLAEIHVRDRPTDS